LSGSCPRGSDDHSARVSVAPGGRQLSALLGLDVGERRIGVALGESSTGSVRPLTTLRRADAGHDAASLRALADEHAVAELVVGLPLERDGSEGPQALATRAWAAAVQPLLGLAVAWRDERYTSQDAEARLGAPRRGRSGGAPSPSALHAYRARVDREAAAGILAAELEARSIVRSDD
jgi:putative transcription antitermination factor YqgF